MWITKKFLKKENTSLKAELKNVKSVLEAETAVKKEVIEYNEELSDKLEFMMKTYPFEIGQTVYDVQLRSAKGRFTKTKASREHSLINEVVVDKKNYFNLVDRYNAQDVFMTLADAEARLYAVCIE